MKMKKSQFREDTATYIQMIHLLNEYNPGWKIILIGVLLEGIFPFIAIFLSSMLLDALYSGRSMQEMALFVLAEQARVLSQQFFVILSQKRKILCGGACSIE